MTLPPLPLGETVPDAALLLCTFGLTVRKCRAPATWHLIDNTREFCLLACDEHLAYIDSHDNTMEDRHPIGGVCCIPGVVWVWSTPDTPGFCAFDFPDGIDQTAEELLTIGTLNPDRLAQI